MQHLSEAQILEIASAPAGESDGDVARRYGIHWKQARKIRKEHFDVLPQEGRQGPQEVSNGPVWGFRSNKGAVEKRLFKDGVLPSAWADSPAGLTGMPAEGHAEYVEVEE